MDRAQQVMTGFRDLYNKMAWLNNVKMRDDLRGYKPSEIHCVEYIAGHADCNVTALAEAFYMTRSAISKLTRKLMEKGLIESYRRPDNKKEIYFRLTEQGAEVNCIHEGLHREFQERDQAVFSQVPPEHFDIMLEFIERYSRHLDGEIEKLGGDSRSGYMDKL